MDTFTTSQKDYQIDAHSEYESKAEIRPPKGWAHQSGYENFDYPSARLEVESGGPLERLLTRIEAIDDLQGPFLRHFYEDRVLGAWRDFLVAQKDEAEQLGNQRKEDLTETTQTTSAATTLNSIKSPESENQAISLKSDTPPQDTLPESQASKEGGSEAQDDEPKSAEEQKAEAKTDEVNTPQDDKSKGSASPFRNQLPELNEKRKHLSKQVDDLAGQLSTLQVEFDERRKEAAVAYGKLGQPYILDPTDDPNAESEPEIKPIALLDKFGQLVGWLAGKQYSHSQREAQAQLADAKSAESWASSCHLPYYPRPEIDSQDIPTQFRNLWSMLYDRRSHLPIMSSTASLFVTLGAGLIIGISLGINLGIIQASELASSLTGSSIATFMNKYGVWALLGFAIALATKHLVLLMFTNFGENVGFEYYHRRLEDNEVKPKKRTLFQQTRALAFLFLLGIACIEVTVQVGGLGGVNSTILESSDAYVSETSPFIPAVIGSALLFFVTYVSYFAAEGYFKGRDVVIKNEIIEKSEADIARQFKEAGVDATILQNAVTAENLANLVAYKIHHVSREKNKLQADMEKLEAVISNLLHAKPIKDKDETSHKTQWFFWTRKSNSNESGDSTATTATNASQTTTGNTGNTSDNAEAATQEDTKILESTMPHTVVHLAYGNYLRVMKEFDDLLKPFCDAKGETAIKSLQSAAAAVLLDLKIEEVKREGSFEAAERARNSARNLTRRLLRLGKFSFCLVTNPGSTARSNGGTANG